MNSVACCGMGDCVCGGKRVVGTGSVVGVGAYERPSYTTPADAALLVKIYGKLPPNIRVAWTPADAVFGVGSWSGFFSGVGNFLGSDFGKAILTVGTTVGGAYLAKELLGDGNQADGQQGSMTSHGYVNPAGSGFIPQASATGSAGQQAPIIIQAASESGWVLPVALGVGALALLAVIATRRR